MTYSGDRSSTARKRALRRLSREQRATYRELYAATRARAHTHDQARGQARTQLRYRYPDRYLELYAQERATPGTHLSPEIRSKAWLKANAALADHLAAPYQQLFEQLRAGGHHNNSTAYDLATAQLRGQHPGLFADLLTDQIRLCLAQTQPPAPPRTCPACGGASQRPGRDTCPPPCGLIHPRCLTCGAALGECRRDDAPAAAGPPSARAASKGDGVLGRLTAAAATIGHMPEAQISAKLADLEARCQARAAQGALPGRPAAGRAAAAAGRGRAS